MVSVFLLFSSFIEDLSIFITVKRCCFLGPKFKFLNPRIFYRIVLALNSGKVGWPGALKIMLVCFASSWARPEYCLGIFVDCFL